MKKSTYLPNGEYDKNIWLGNFSAKLVSIGPTVGITQAEITATTNDAKAVAYVLNCQTILKSDSQERTKYKDLLFDGEIGSPLGDLPALPDLSDAPTAVPAGVFKRIAKIVQRIKNHPSYNDSIGKALDIIGADQVIDYENLKVQITVRHTNDDGVALDYVKGQMQGVVVYAGTLEQPATNGTNPPATTDQTPVMVWSEIGRATVSPYIDTRDNASNQPEKRYYQMRYLLKDQPVGKDSDTIIVISTKFKQGSLLSGKPK